ncbi:MAG: acylphosphatase [Lachnospiraceae bacterium]|jgi:acylphosphatase
MIDDEVRKRIIFHGRVQGVGFRYKARTKASELGLSGWVRNEHDGTVLMEIQGTEAKIDILIKELMEDRYIEIRRMDVKKIEKV